jgi:hypothetical protein
MAPPRPPSSQNLSQLGLLDRCQGRGELDVVLEDEVAPRARLLGDGHAEARERLGAAGLRRAGLVEVELLAVDCRYRPLPARQGLLEIEVDAVDEVVALADVEGVLLLLKKKSQRMRAKGGRGWEANAGSTWELTSSTIKCRS